MALDWDELRVVLALARAKSFGAAARELKLDPTTVGRRLASIEAELGVRLVTRTPEGVAFTPEGALVVDAAAKMEEVLSGLKRRLEGVGSGLVRLTSTESLTQYLFSHLPELQQEHPGLRVEFIADNATLDLRRGEADLAVRLYRPKDDDLVVRKVGTIGWSLYGSDAYLARKGRVDLHDLGRHEVVCFDEALKSVPGAVWLAQHAPGATVAVRGNSPHALSVAVGAGLGISVLPCFIAAGNPLLRRLTPEVLATTEAWIAVHADLKSVPRVRAVLDFVTRVFEREAALFAGAQA
jgi:DNA-binding transcriptional LysR family regulator